jgi:hypothetical protein
VKTIKKTKKLKRAVMVLSDEGYSDTSEGAWYEALQKGKITTSAIYRAMTAYGLKWDAMQGTWYTKARRTPFVKTMFSIVRKIDDRLLKEQGYL